MGRIFAKPFARRRLAGALILGLAAGPAAAQEECPLLRAGSWMLQTDPTTTLAGPGGPGGSAPFELSIGACGAVLTLSNFGSAETGTVKTFVQGSDGVYLYNTVVQGAPLTVTLTMTDGEHFNNSWNFANFAFSQGRAWFLDGALAAGEPDPRCGCPSFTEQLLARIEANDAAIARYSDPLLREAPPGFDKDSEWTSGVMQRWAELIDPDGAARLFPEEALRQLHTELRTGTLLDPEGGGTGSGTRGYLESLDCESCRGLPVEPVAGCAGDVLTGAGQSRQAAVAARCDEENATGPVSPTDATPGYCRYTRVPANLLDEKVAAYQAENAYIRARYQELCFMPLG